MIPPPDACGATRPRKQGQVLHANFLTEKAFAQAKRFFVNYSHIFHSPLPVGELAHRGTVLLTRKKTYKILPMGKPR